MAISVHTLFVVALVGPAVAAAGGRQVISRRLRRPYLVHALAAIAALVLVPANLYCATLDHPSGALLALELCVGALTFAALCGLAALVSALWIHKTPALAPRRVLAVGAHPDDLELGCGGAMAKLSDSGHEVHGLVMSGGEQGGDGSARPDEARTGGRLVGAATLEVFGFSDTRLEDHELEMTRAIEAAVLRYSPDIIFTHSANDQHQDHLAVHRATLRAARQHPAVLCYESPSTNTAFTPSVFVDIDDYVDRKSAAVATHRDQDGKPYMSSERVAGLAVYRGGQAKVRHAEAYEPIRLLGSTRVQL